MSDYMCMPALMKEQEQEKKKDRYIEITNVLVEAGKEVKTTEEKCDYLTALVDTLEHMDFQIYELYRKLQDTFKAVLKEVLRQYETLGEAEKEKVSDAIGKACGLRLLLEEKYTEYIR